jgi:hypothetical protein
MMHVSFTSIVVLNALLFHATTMRYFVTTVDATENVTTHPSTMYCSCQYNVPFEDEADCRSYGQLGDDVLIPWYRANQTCLDEYQIKSVAIDRDVLLEICPYENATDADVQLILNEIRFNPSPATRAIQASYPLFWIESNTTIGSYELVSVINDGRNNPNCELSETLCYNTIREYFTLFPNELGTACQEFHARNRYDTDLEQSTIRIRLCQEVGAASTTSSNTDGSVVNVVAPSCEPLITQIIETKSQNPSKACSAFGLGPGTKELPTKSNSNCSDSATNTNTNTPSGSCRQCDHHALLVGLIAIIMIHLV